MVSTAVSDAATNGYSAWVPPPAPDGVGNLRGVEKFPIAARRALADTQLRRNLGKATTTIRAKRAQVVAELPDWEQLRERAVSSRFTRWRSCRITLRSWKLQWSPEVAWCTWARDANEANAIVVDLVRDKAVDDVVKVKSMATQEIGGSTRRWKQPASPHGKPISRS